MIILVAECVGAGAFTVAGGPFGTTPTTIELPLPRVASDDEAAQLRAWAFELGTKLVAARARGWLLRHLLAR